MTAPPTPRPAPPIPAANVYDLLKVLALVAMTVDHLRFLLAAPPSWGWGSPLWVIGRAALPLFALLVGMNPSLRVPRRLWGAAAGAQVVWGWGWGLWWPLNVLFPLLLVRLTLPTLRARLTPCQRLITYTLLSLPALLTWDYGMIPWLFADVGRSLAHHPTRQSRLALSGAFLCLWGLYSITPPLLSLFQAERVEVGWVVGFWALPVFLTGAILYESPFRTLGLPRWLVRWARGAWWYYPAHLAVLALLALLTHL